MSQVCMRGKAAPSSTLLRFLRSQADDLYFSDTSSYRSASLPFCTPKPGTRSSRCRIVQWEGSSRAFSMTTRQSATMEASLLSLDFLHTAQTSATACLPRLYSKSRPGIDNRSGAPDYFSASAPTQRSVSSDSRLFMKRISEFRRKNEQRSALRPNDLPPLGMLHDPSGTIFGRSKATNELKLRCTEFDENGKVVLVNGEFKKTELIAKYGLLPRDLRKIDSSLLPSILVRPSSILVNLLHLRVLIQSNRVLVFDAYGSTNSYTQSVFMYDLEGKLSQKESARAISNGTALPYEFRALEAVLISVTSGLEGEFEGIREPVVRVLRELEEDIDRDKLRHLLVYSKKLGTFEQKARLVRDAIDAILDEDEDLSAMYLTERVQGHKRDEEEHTEIEMLLESYHKVCDEIVQNSGNLVSNIRNTEEIIKAILDANRNSLMLLDLKFSIGTLGMGSGAFVAALYGMNLKNFIEESDIGFFGISGLSAIMAAVVCVYGLTKLRKVQRVSMWGEQGSNRRAKMGHRGSWNNISANSGAEGGLPGEGRAERVERLMREKRAGLGIWGARSEADKESDKTDKEEEKGKEKAEVELMTKSG